MTLIIISSYYLQSLASSLIHNCKVNK